jgi:hypothetical protein
MLQAGRSPVQVPDEMDFFNLPNPSSHTMALRSTQPVAEMSTRNFPGGKRGQCVGLTTLPSSISRMSENVGALTSRNPKGLHGLYRENFTLLGEVQIELHVKDHNDSIGSIRTKVKFSPQLLMQTSSSDFCLNHFE